MVYHCILFRTLRQLVTFSVSLYVTAADPASESHATDRSGRPSERQRRGRDRRGPERPADLSGRLLCHQLRGHHTYTRAIRLPQVLQVSSSLELTGMSLLPAYANHSSSPWTQFMSLNSVHVPELSSCPWTQFMSLNSVHVPALSSCPWTQFLSLNSVHVPELSSCPWTQFMFLNSVHVPELSSCPWTQFMSLNSVHVPELSSCLWTQFM